MGRAVPVGVVLLVLLGSGRGHAAVVDSTAAGFLIRSEAQVQAGPDSVYRALVRRVGDWWDPEHTWSGDARNLSLDDSPGGCFCERLPDGGGVRHLTVVYASPARILRLVGGLGPLQEAGVAGSLTWELAAVPGGTRVRLSYAVGGFRPGGLQQLAGPVDAVLGALLARLTRFVETGRPVPE